MRTLLIAVRFGAFLLVLAAAALAAWRLGIWAGPVVLAVFAAT